MGRFRESTGHLDRVVVSSGPFLIFNNFQRELSNGPRVLNCEVSAILGYQRLKSFELSAPDRFDVTVPACIPRFGWIAERNRSDLKEVGLRSSRKLNAVSGIGRLPKNNSASIDPGRRHSLRNFVTQTREAMASQSSCTTVNGAELVLLNSGPWGLNRKSKHQSA